MSAPCEAGKNNVREETLLNFAVLEGECWYDSPGETDQTYLTAYSATFLSWGMSNSWTGTLSETSLKSMLGWLENYMWDVNNMLLIRDLRPTRATFVGVWSPGPVFNNKDRSLMDPVKGIRRILNRMLFELHNVKISIQRDLTADRRHPTPKTRNDFNMINSWT